MGSIKYGAHPLDASPSPLVRALPDYERQFRHHLQTGTVRARGLQMLRSGVPASPSLPGSAMVLTDVVHPWPCPGDL